MEPIWAEFDGRCGICDERIVEHVHLTVFSPGVPEQGPNGELMDRVASPPLRARASALPPGARSFNLAGTYQEWDVPFFDPAPSGNEGEGKALPVSCAPTIQHYGELEQLAGSWTWPERR
jgi:hypothetical protein